MTKFNSRKVAYSQLPRQAMPQILICKHSGVGVEAAMAGSDSDYDSGLVTTAPGHSDSGSDYGSATLEGAMVNKLASA